MNHFDPLPFALEPERYELADDPMFSTGVDRREFFKTLGCGLVVLFLLDSATAQQETGGGGRRGGRGGGARPTEISAWIHIGADGTVSVFTGKAEVGQNARTSLTQAVAEELPVPPDQIKLIMADTKLVPFDMGTFGSQTTPNMFPQLRRVGAAAREALLDLAAAHFQVERASLKLAEGAIIRPDTGAKITFAELTKGQNLVKSVTDAAPLHPATDWKIAGTSRAKIGGPDYVTGRHQYASDIKRPGMLHGKILRPVAYNATLTSVDTRAAAALPGVTVVHEGDFVGVAAPDSLQAARALDALVAEWQTSPQPSSQDLYAYLKEHVTNGGGGRGGGQNAGSVTEGLALAEIKQVATYNIAYIAHAPLEPRAAVAEWTGDQLTVWTGTQRPFGIRGDLAQALGVPEERVRVIVPDTGSGYGGKHAGSKYAGDYTGDPAVEAARLARAAGRPVRVVWTREEEFTWSYFRPAGVIDIASGITKEGRLTAWEFHNYNSGGSGLPTPYNVPHVKSQFHATAYPLKQGSYRGLAATANHFARECHMDELARLAKIDPLAFRLLNLTDPRLRAVLEAAAKTFGWGASVPRPGHGFGLAGGTEKGSYVAACAEVTADRQTGAVRVLRTVTAFECGAIVNPDQLKNQVEGAVVMGLGGALFEAMEFDKLRITNPRFSEYRVPRFADIPTQEVVLLDRRDLPSAGAGETPIVAIAPALANAIFDATGIRLRSLPLVPDGLKAPA